MAQAGKQPVHVQDDPFASVVAGMPAASEPYQFSAPAYCHQDCLDGCGGAVFDNACPSIYGRVEALFMTRDPRFTDRPIVVDPNTNTTFLSTSDLDFGFDPGLRATLGMLLYDNRTLEFSYFGLFEEESSSVALAPDPGAFLIFPDNFAGNVFVDMDRVRARYSSELHSFEVNLPSCCGCCDQCSDQCGCCGAQNQCGRGNLRCRSVEWFAGFRYLHLGEEFDIAAQRTVGGLIEEGAYNIRTTNNLYGGQLGARLRSWVNRFGGELTGKAGIYGYDAEQTQSVTDFPNFALRPTVSNSGGGVAFLGEINLSAFYRLTDVWSVRAGYNTMWIEGLALAPDQLDFNFADATSGAQLNDGGGMFLHGASAGVEARW
jgi:hypothetical protein